MANLPGFYDPFAGANYTSQGLQDYGMNLVNQSNNYSYQPQQLSYQGNPAPQQNNFQPLQNYPGGSAGGSNGAYFPSAGDFSGGNYGGGSFNQPQQAWNGGQAGAMLNNYLNGQQINYGNPSGGGYGGGGFGGALNIGGGIAPGLANKLATSYTDAYNEAKKANLDRYNQLVDANSQLRGRAIQNAQAGVDAAQGLTKQVAPIAQQNVGLADSLYNRGSGLAQQGTDLSNNLYSRNLGPGGTWDQYVTGAQSKINQDYTSAQQAEKARLSAAGLSNSTVLEGAMKGIDANRAQQLGLLAQNQVGLDQSLTGNQQQARYQQLNADQALTAQQQQARQAQINTTQQLSANEQAARQNYNTQDVNTTQGVLGVIERRSDPYASPDQYAQTMLQFAKMGAFGGAGGYGSGSAGMGYGAAMNAMGPYSYGNNGGTKSYNYSPIGGYNTTAQGPGSGLSHIPGVVGGA